MSILHGLNQVCLLNIHIFPNKVYQAISNYWLKRVGVYGSVQMADG